MTQILGPLLIALGVIALAYGAYMFWFANRDPRTSRQKNLDTIAKLRGDKKGQKPGKKATGRA